MKKKQLNIYTLNESFCFVLILFCFACYNEIFRTVDPPTVFLVLSESPLRGGVHKLCFMAFRLAAEKISIFEVFMNYKITT